MNEENTKKMTVLEITTTNLEISFYQEIRHVKNVVKFQTSTFQREAP